MNSRLLIVEDDEEIRTQMKWALGKDYELLFAENRTAAIETFRSARPGVVLLDLGLPLNRAIPKKGWLPFQKSWGWTVSQKSSL